MSVKLEESEDLIMSLLVKVFSLDVSGLASLHTNTLGWLSLSHDLVWSKTQGLADALRNFGPLHTRPWDS